MKTRKWLFAALALVLAGLIIMPMTTTHAAEGSSYVSFTGKSLNPVDPNLPVTDATPSRRPLPDTHGEPTRQVVVNTTPEKNKAVSRTTLAETSPSAPVDKTRTKLPQTGSVELPSIVVLIAIVAGVGVSLRMFKRTARAVA